MRARAIIVLMLICFIAPVAAAAAGGPFLSTPAPASAPDAALAQELLGLEGPVSVVRVETPAPGWEATGAGGASGFIASTWEVARSVGYSGRPLDILVAVGADARIAGARLMRHNEPILTLGISTEDIARYVDEFAGYDLTRADTAALEAGDGLPDVISGATVSTGVIRDSILRTAQAVAASRGGGRIDRVTFEPRTWAQLVDGTALAHAESGLDDARRALSGARMPPPEGEGAFLDLWVAVIDPPTIGRSLLGGPLYSRVMAGLGPDEAGLFVASRGLHSHRGVDWRKTGEFDRLELIQDGPAIRFDAQGYRRIDRLAIEGAPDFKEISVFRIPADLVDPAQEFRVEAIARREGAQGGIVEMRIPVTYRLPSEFLRAAGGGEFEPLWVSAWERRKGAVIGVALMLATLTAILFLQQSFVRRPKVWLWGRIAFLSVTLVWLGWIAGGQLSVVQVIAFFHSLLSGFRWETFLIEPVIFLLWSFVALGLLFWGRGVFCGWLCPFGALQELTNRVAQRLGVPQIEVPYVLHERLWAIKYTLFVAILALSLYSMDMALVLAEAEPFKTAMSLHFMRAWPFVLFVVALLAAGLFIERFYCRYLCPLGAALAIPAKLKLFDWLRRRPQCGRECRLCEQKCTVGAIDPLGRISPNECVLCLRCQMIFHDDDTCTVLKGRKARAARAAASAAAKQEQTV